MFWNTKFKNNTAAGVERKMVMKINSNTLFS